MIIDVSRYQEELNLLERIHFELKARENILTFLIQKNQNFTPQYKKYYEEYIQYLKAQDIAKQQFETNCINKELGHNFTGKWTVKYDKKEVVINE